MKKLVFLHKNLVIGGVEKVLLNLLKNLDKNKFQVKLILFEKEGDLISEIPNNVEVIYLKKQYLTKNSIFLLKVLKSLINILSYFFQLKKIIKEDEILLNINMRNIIANCSIYFFRNKKIGWIHGNILNDFGKISEKFNYKLFNQYSKIFNISKQGKKDFDDKFPNLKNKSELLYNSFDVEKIIKRSNEENIKEKDFLLTIGRLDFEKGFDLLINAMFSLKENGINEKLYIIGDGKERENLENQIKKLNLENDVFLLGFKTNPYPWLKNSKLYILPSRGEGFGLVLVEALACQKAIVSANCLCGPNEILDNGKYGLLVETENSSALKEGIKKLLLDKELKENYENKALKRAYYFSNESILKKLEREICNL